MSLNLHLPQRTKLLLDLEGQARLSRGDSPERCTPARLVETVVEKAFGRRWARRVRSSALNAEEERRLRDHRGVLGLTPRRLELLIHSLRPEAFRIAQLGRLAGLAGAQPGSVALRALHARGLIRLQRLGPWHMSLWHAERGPALERWLRPLARPRERLGLEEERRLRVAGRALGLKPRRLELLIHSLKRESFELSELAQLSGLMPGTVGPALRSLQARDLIRLHRSGPWRLSGWRAERGPALERWLRPPVALTTRGVLRIEEARRLREDGRALGLRPRRLDLLVQSLKTEGFEVSELARLSGMTHQGVSLALRDLQARGLIRLHRLGWKRSRAEMGAALEPWLRGVVRPPHASSQAERR